MRPVKSVCLCCSCFLKTKDISEPCPRVYWQHCGFKEYIFILFYLFGCTGPQLWHSRFFFFFLVVTWELLPVLCGIQFPDQPSNPGRGHWEYRVLASGPPGKSQHCELQFYTKGLFPCCMLFLFVQLIFVISPGLFSDTYVYRFVELWNRF